MRGIQQACGLTDGGGHHAKDSRPPPGAEGGPQGRNGDLRCNYRELDSDDSLNEPGRVCFPRASGREHDPADVLISALCVGSLTHRTVSS